MKLFKKKELKPEEAPQPNNIDEVPVSNNKEEQRSEEPTMQDIVLNMTELEYRTTILTALNEIILKLREK
jgi:hypothetical protein